MKSKDQLVTEIRMLRNQLARRQAPDGLFGDAETFRLIFENAPIGIAYVSADFQLLKVNEALCDIVGFSEAELLGRSFVEFTYPDDTENDVRLAEQLFRQEISRYQLEKRYITKAGQVVWCNLSVTRMRMKDGTHYALGMVENITESKAAEEALKLSESRYRTLMEQAADGIMLFDLQGVIIGTNTKVCEMMGYQSEELLHKNAALFLSPEDKQTLPQRLQLLREGRILIGERTLIRKDGSPIQVEISSRQLPDQTLHSIVRDITARKQAEAEREELIQQLQQALAEVKTLSELLPICSSCKKIRDDQGYWKQIETYITEYTGTLFSHCICRDCAKKLYPSYYQKIYPEAPDEAE